MAFQLRIVRAVESAFVQVLQAYQAAGSLPAGYDILPGHEGAKLDGNTARLVVTAYRPRLWLEEGGNYELQIQLKLLNVANVANAMELQDTVIASLEALLGPDNREAALADLNASGHCWVNVLSESLQPHEEARSKEQHGTVMDYDVLAALL